MAAFHAGLRVHILGLAYTAKDRRGRLYVEAGESINEEAIIRYFQAIDPDVERVEFYHESVLVFVSTMGESHWEILYAD